MRAGSGVRGLVQTDWQEKGDTRKRLTPALAEGTGNDTTTGTEAPEWVELETSPESIAFLADDKVDGAEEAKKHSHRPGKMFFWRDDSILDF